jgi:hypothetical protein
MMINRKTEQLVQNNDLVLLRKRHYFVRILRANCIYSKRILSFLVQGYEENCSFVRNYFFSFLLLYFRHAPLDGIYMYYVQQFCIYNIRTRYTINYVFV